jgi:membrane protease YdiL (CAAX protease family)
MIKRSALRGTWGLKGPVGALAVYACVLFPALHLGFPVSRQWAHFIYPVYFGLVVLILILKRAVTWRQLGLHREHWKQNLLLGGGIGMLVIQAVPLLDLFIGSSGLDQTDLFAGSGRRVFESPESPFSLAAYVGTVMLIPLAQQLFLTGYLLQALLRKTKPSLAVYLGGIIFTLVHFDLELGLFLLGLTASGLYFMTGSLIAPLTFQIACATAGWLLTHHYPRVFTLLGFLF